MTTVREIMSTSLVTVAPDDTVAEAATAMGRNQTGSALVIGGGTKTLVGIFTERDIVRALGTDFDAPGNPVSHWMTSDPTTTDPDVDVGTALERMLAGGFRHLPVMENGEVVGIVSIRDLSRAAVEE